MNFKRLFLQILTACLLLSACALPGTAQVTDPPPATLPDQTSTPVPSRTAAPLPSATATVEPTFTPTAAPSSTPEPSATATIEPTASPIPTYPVLRGVVIPEKVSCRYGPGWMYLYLYGMVSGATQDVIGRTELMTEQLSDGSWEQGTWVLTRSRGDNKACWVKTKFMDIQGDVMSLEVVYPEKYIIPHSNQGYRYPWNVAAVRKGNQVTITWESEALRPGDEESATSVLYVVETWVCRGGQLYFSPVGAYRPQVTVIDEPGCSTPSHGRVYFSEKHGYAGPTEIDWP